jgi:hypothetical protein
MFISPLNLSAGIMFVYQHQEQVQIARDENEKGISHTTLGK